MRNSSKLLPLALLLLAAFPVAAQEPPRVLFCMGQCFGVDDKGTRIPVTKGTELAPGLRLETGPDSYAQVRLGRELAFGIGERARVRFDRRDAGRDVVILDEGRIRMVGGEAIGRPVTRPVELQTSEGNFALRSADIEVKALPRSGDAVPATTLVKLNLGDARLGDLPITREAVQGFVGGKALDKAIPIGDIAMLPRKDVAPVAPVVGTAPAVRPIGLTVAPAVLSPDTTSPLQTQLTPTLLGTVATSPALVYRPVQMTPVYTAPIVPASTLILAQPITTSTGTTSLNNVAKTIQSAPTTTTTLSAPLTQTFTLQPTLTTTTTSSTTLSPKFTTTIRR